MPDGKNIREIFFISREMGFISREIFFYFPVFQFYLSRDGLRFWRDDFLLFSVYCPASREIVFISPEMGFIFRKIFFISLMFSIVIAIINLFTTFVKLLTTINLLHEYER
jgi:hypothetical protein